MEDIILGLIVSYPWIGIGVAVMGTAVTVATAIVPFTSTKRDDQALMAARRKLGPFLNFLERFSLIRRKP